MRLVDCVPAVDMVELGVARERPAGPARSPPRLAVVLFRPPVGPSPSPSDVVATQQHVAEATTFAAAPVSCALLCSAYRQTASLHVRVRGMENPVGPPCCHWTTWEEKFNLLMLCVHIRLRL